MSLLNQIEIEQHKFPTKEYYQGRHKKVGVVLHHTTSGSGVAGDINWWKRDPKHIATPIIVDRDGKVHQLYSSKYWAHHLGVKSYMFSQFGLPSKSGNKYANTKLNQEFIGLEIDSWGGLVRKNGKWLSWTGQPVDDSRVIVYNKGFRGYKAFEKYTDEQIESVRVLLLYWNKYYGIPLDYKKGMWEFNERALSGESGIWTHVSFRPDKSDCHPQPELIKMLKSLSNG